MSQCGKLTTLLMSQNKDEPNPVAQTNNYFATQAESTVGSKVPATMLKFHAAVGFCKRFIEVKK